MGRDIEVGDHAAVVSEHNEAEQYAERRRRNCEEINGHNVFSVIVQERTPCLRRGFARANSVLVDG